MVEERLRQVLVHHESRVDVVVAPPVEVLVRGDVVPGTDLRVLVLQGQVCVPHDHRFTVAGSNFPGKAS